MENMKTWAVPYAYFCSDDDFVAPKVAIIMEETPFKALVKARFLIRKTERAAHPEDPIPWVWLSDECITRLQESGITPNSQDFEESDEEGWILGYPQNREVINEYHVNL